MNGAEQRSRQYPASGMAAAAIAATVAATASWLAWPDMADTYAEVSGPEVTPSVLNRTSAAISIPLLLAFLAIAPMPVLLGDRWLTRVFPGINPPRTRTTLRNRARFLSAVWVGLSVLFVMAHLAILSQFTGRSVDVAQLMGIGFGILIVCIGTVLPLARPEDPSTYAPEFTRLAAGLEAAYRPGGFALVGLGVATIAVSAFWPIGGLMFGWIGFVAVMVAMAIKVARA